MSFSLSSKSHLAEGLLEVAISEIDSVTLASAAESPLDERVHETRKSIKRLRALLRLYRGALSHALFELEDSRLREIGRSLGRARDIAALRESFDKLLTSASPSHRAPLADHSAPLTNALVDGPSSSPEEVTSALRAAHDGLGAVRERAPSWRVERSGWSAIAAGYRRTYARGRKGLARALRQPSEERLHDFRIDAKRHQYQLTLLEPLWPDVVKAYRQEAQRLGDLLGEDHDLSLLERRYREVRERTVMPEPVENALRAAVDECRVGLRRNAFDLAARLYAESPGRFVERYREYYDAWV